MQAHVSVFLCLSSSSSEIRRSAGSMAASIDYAYTYEPNPLLAAGLKIIERVRFKLSRFES